MPSAEESLILLGSSPGAVSWTIVGEGDAPGFQNGWSSLDTWTDTETGLAAPHFRKTQGLVCIEGAAGGGSAVDAIFTLPEGYRPQQATVFAVPTVGPNASVGEPTGLALLIVLPDGQVGAFNPVIFDPGSETPISTPASGGFGVSMNGLVFTTNYS